MIRVHSLLLQLLRHYQTQSLRHRPAPQLNGYYVVLLLALEVAPGKVGVASIPGRSTLIENEKGDAVEKGVKGAAHYRGKRRTVMQEAKDRRAVKGVRASKIGKGARAKSTYNVPKETRKADRFQVTLASSQS